MGIALTKKIFRFMNFICRVDGYQHRADLGRGPESDEPGRNVCRPDRNLAPGFYTEGNQSAGKLIHILAELLVGSGIIQGGIAECVLIGK